MFSYLGKEDVENVKRYKSDLEETRRRIIVGTERINMICNDPLIQKQSQEWLGKQHQGVRAVMKGRNPMAHLAMLREIGDEEASVATMLPDPSEPVPVLLFGEEEKRPARVTVGVSALVVDR